MRLAAAAALCCAGVAGPAQAATIATVAGTAAQTGSYAGDGVSATAAKLNAPRAIAPTADGGLLIADEGNAVVRRVDPRGVITRVAGRANDPGSDGDGGAATNAHLDTPRGVAPLLGGGFVIADHGAGRVRLVDPFGVITTLAGTGAACTVPAGTPACGDGGPARAATLSGPSGIVALPDGRVLVSDEAAHRVRVIAPDGTIATFAGTGVACAVPSGPCGDGGAATAAALDAPAALAIASDGAVLVADPDAHKVRRIAADGTIGTVAGTGIAGRDGDGGPATAAELHSPTGVAAAPDGSILVADTFNQVVRRVTADGRIALLAGTRSTPCDPVAVCGDGGDATAARLFTPSDVAVAPDGGVLVADHNTQRVRRVDSGLRLASSPGLRPSGVSVSGNRLQDDATGAPLRLLGANRAALGDACVKGELGDGPLTAESIGPMVAWRMTAVRVPINQDCWLGVRGLPAPGGGTAAEYRARVVAYVRALEQQGLAVVLDNQFGAVPLPGTASTLLPPLPDASALAFLSSLAQTFRADDDVLFDVFNEPHPDSKEDGFNLANVPPWTCWRDGCGRHWVAPSGAEVDYVAVGLQAMVDAVRATGARQPILAGGVRYASDLRGWLAYRPADPAGQLVAAAHFYEFQDGTVFGTEGRDRVPGETPAAAPAARRAAWDDVLGPVAATVPLVAAEVGEFDCDHDFSQQFFDWADAHGVSYLGWTWNAADGVGWFCDGGTTPGRGGPALISSYDGTPTPFGDGLRRRLLGLVDRTAPSISVRVPQPGQHVAQGAAVAAAFGCADDDGGSGVKTCAGPAQVDTATPGPHRLTVTAADRSGNAAAQSVDYVVDAPVAPPPAPPRPRPVVSLAGVPARIAVSATGRLSLPLRCTSPAVRCRGALRLTITVRRRAVTVGTGRYAIAGGRRAAVRVTVTRAGRVAVAGAPRRRLAVRLTLLPEVAASPRRTKALTLVGVAPRPARKPVRRPAATAGRSGAA